jgi:putative membrane-bound dehydrogenase-like protein
MHHVSRSFYRRLEQHAVAWPLILLGLCARGAGSEAAHPHGREAALADIKQMTVADGLEVSLFACEPQLVNPCDMDVDAKGRVWITEGANYRSTFQRWGTLRPGGDRIVILEDTDHDGVADKSKVFYQGTNINSALGICVLGNRVIVSCSPRVMVFTDRDGDDRADGEPEVWFNGIHGVDHDHGVHSFVFGPDGKLYFNMGNEGRQLKSPDASAFVVDAAGNEVKGEGKPYRQGMIFRCNLDGSGVETLAWNFRNNFEVNLDSFGTLWQSDNDDDGNKSVRINYVMEYGNYGYVDELTGAGWGDAWKKANQNEKISEDLKPRYHWHMDDPGVVPTLLVTGAGSPTGLAIYEGKLLPEIFRGQMIHCDAGPRVVRSYPVSSTGAGYQARIVDLVSSKDSWFRPSDVCVAPDGSLLVADWNDAGVGGHNMADRSLEEMTGRVYRIAPKGSGYSVPKVDLTSAAGAVAALQSPNGATRFQAWTALHAMGSQAESELGNVWKGKEPRMRARALQLLARIPRLEEKYLGQAIRDSDPDIRITGLRIAKTQDRDVLAKVKQLARDASPAVRRECAIALRHNTSPDAAKLWVSLARQHDGKDRWYLEALGIGADQQWDRFFAVWLEAVGDKWNTPPGRDIIWRSRAPKAAGYLAKLATDKNTSDKARYIRALDFINGPEKEQALVEIATQGF